MRRYILHEPFNIYHFHAKKWEHPVHNHTYFEIIFILKGKGYHNINDNRFAYKSGDIFLLGPEDYHSFEIKSQTEFCYIRFMESFSKYSNLDKDKNWQHTVKVLLHTRFQSKGSVVRNQAETEKLFQLLALLQAEYNNRHDAGFEVMRDSLMKAMMMILARNIMKTLLPESKKVAASNSISEVITYIRENIYAPEKLRMDHLCDRFNCAPGYLGIYFKKHTGESLKQYIVKYKLRLIETRLLHSNVSLARIADEFGFTDESHLAKQFRKYMGVAPGGFRNARVKKGGSFS